MKKQTYPGGQAHYEKFTSTRYIVAGAYYHPPPAILLHINILIEVLPALPANIRLIHMGHLLSVIVFTFRNRRHHLSIRLIIHVKPIV